MRHFGDTWLFNVWIGVITGFVALLNWGRPVANTWADWLPPLLVGFSIVNFLIAVFRFRVARATKN